MTSPDSISSSQAAQEWLSHFGSACEHANVDDFVESIRPNGWFRDMLTFSWDFRSRHGHEEIRSYLLNTLGEKHISNVKLDTHFGLQPKIFPFSEGIQGVELAFTFETPVALGRGAARILPDGTTASTPLSWKALTVMMMIDNWKGHEELPHESGLFGGHTIAWEDILKSRREAIEKDPYVVIVGAGQAGLQQAARNRQLGLKTLVIEKDARLGDVWRKRYPTLVLHTPRAHSSLLYQPFPSNWPIFTPKDKVATWFEQYAESQDLVVWLSTTLHESPVYDKESKRWNLTINRQGTIVKLNPAHLVMATGHLGDPMIPAIPGMDEFKGITTHAAYYSGGAKFKNKNVVVVGACNTSHDLCQDLVHQGAASVTMVQRSRTLVVSLDLMMQRMTQTHPDDVAEEISDFKFSAVPLGFAKEMSKAMQPAAEEHDKEILDGLKNVGFKLSSGDNGGGIITLLYRRGGGYFVDIGVAKLIADGKIKIKQGSELARFTPSSIVFTDGTELSADVVIFATGYYPATQKLRKILPAEIMDKTPEIWGLDAENEINGIYRLTGYPGLWFAAGGFQNGRSMSKQLALRIKAIEIGLTSFDELYGKN